MITSVTGIGRSQLALVRSRSSITTSMYFSLCTSVLGATLLRKMDEANEEHQAHANAFEELNGALNLETTTGWRADVEHWEENPNDLSVRNPFKTNVSSKSICLNVSHDI